MGIRILLADDHNLMREGMRTLISGEPGMTVIAEAKDGGTAVRLAEELMPDLIIMDVSMPGVSGIEATRQLTEAKTASKIIALSMHLDRRVVLDMLSAGASGYLLKECLFEEVVLAVQAVVSGGMYLSPAVLGPLLKDFVRQTVRKGSPLPKSFPSRERNVLGLLAGAKGPAELASLLKKNRKTAGVCLRRLIVEYIVPSFLALNADSPAISLDAREREILAWLKDGKNTWEISSILGLSEATVKYHLRKSFQKLNASNRTQAIAVALDNNLIEM